MLKNNEKKNKYKYYDNKMTRLNYWRTHYNFLVKEEDYEEIKPYIKTLKNINFNDIKTIMNINYDNVNKNDMEVYAKNYKYI